MTDDSDFEFNAKLTCDLTPFNLGHVECDASIEFGPCDDPESVVIRIPISRDQVGNLYANRSLDLEQYFGSPDFEGKVVETETTFKGKVVLVKGIKPIGMFESVHLTCVVEDFEFLDGNSGVAADIVVFRLTNVPLRLRGDIGVARPVSDRPPSPLETDYFETSELHTLNEKERQEIFRPGWQFSASRINFSFGGCNWSLDTTQGYTDAKIKAARLYPMITATLTTKATDITVPLEELADHICDLLTFAFGKEVRWVSCGRFTRNGHSRSQCRAFPLLPYGKGAGAIVNNWEIGNLKQFLEECESAFNTNSDWWHRSIGLIAHSRATPLLEIRLTTLNTLMDRISKKVIAGNETAEIDSQLPVHIDQPSFRSQLHSLFCTLSPNWDEERTNSVCGMIIQWNSSPSFPNQIAQACEALGIMPPARKQLGFRHKLIHVGEFDKNLKTTDQMFEYLESLEAVVELMMIQLLGFTGYVHIDNRGPKWQKVKAYLSTEDDE